MADALALRHGSDYRCDDLLEPADDLARRARWRCAARRAFANNALEEWLAAHGCNPQWIDGCTWFGEIWQTVEVKAPPLRKARLTPAQLDLELLQIATLIDEARAARGTI